MSTIPQADKYVSQRMFLCHHGKSSPIDPHGHASIIIFRWDNAGHWPTSLSQKKTTAPVHICAPAAMLVGPHTAVSPLSRGSSSPRLIPQCLPCALH
eukprot:1502469-Amphidinium_carterae.2